MARAAKCGRWVAAAVCMAGLAGAVSGCGGGSRASAAPRTRTTVWSAGSSVDFPIYEEADSLLSGRGITLNYQQIAAGPALAGFRAGRLAFVAADGTVPAPGPLHRLGGESTPAVAVPVALIGEAVIYNVPSLRARLRLDGRVLADIYRGRVTLWNDREIARQNPGVPLPPLAIKVVERGDPSAATAALTTYMAAQSRRWRRTVGSGETVSWPGGTADTGDSTLLATVTETPGAIGYTEEPVVRHNGLVAAALRTAAGTYAGPTPGAIASGRYPLIATAYAVTSQDLCTAGLSPAKAAATQRLLAYLLGPGQAMVRRLAFVGVPRHARSAALREVHRLQCGGQSIT